MRVQHWMEDSQWSMACVSPVRKKNAVAFRHSFEIPPPPAPSPPQWIGLRPCPRPGAAALQRLPQPHPAEEHRAHRRRHALRHAGEEVPRRAGLPPPVLRRRVQPVPALHRDEGMSWGTLPASTSPSWATVLCRTTSGLYLQTCSHFHAFWAVLHTSILPTEVACKRAPTPRRRGSPRGGS